MTDLFSYSLSPSNCVLIGLVALLTGMSKTGVHGAGMLSAPLLALVFGGHNSSGIILPMLIIADVFGVFYYHRHASWKHLKLLLPWAAVGIIAGTFAGAYIDDKTFKIIMAITIFVSIPLMIWLKQGEKDSIPKAGWFSVSTGIAGGFTSMVGNLAGSVMAVYLLAARLPKNVYIGTTAWFFLVINWAKVPFHVFSWHTITLNTVFLSLITLPLILLGAIAGVFIIKKVPEEYYRGFIIIMTIVAAVSMLL
ncbi:MAG: sulfite exporter TauE/SafE family protein [Sphingobacteriaceae bacterium]|nr:sulfite exporter TauE/SafE family protein [Sphingobacteriaceae bacterium]